MESPKSPASPSSVPGRAIALSARIAAHAAKILDIRPLAARAIKRVRALFARVFRRSEAVQGPVPPDAAAPDDGHDSPYVPVAAPDASTFSDVVTEDDSGDDEWGAYCRDLAASARGLPGRARTVFRRLVALRAVVDERNDPRNDACKRFYEPSLAVARFDAMAVLAEIEDLTTGVDRWISRASEDMVTDGIGRLSKSLRSWSWKAEKLVTDPGFCGTPECQGALALVLEKLDRFAGRARAEAGRHGTRTSGL